MKELESRDTARHKREIISLTNVNYKNVKGAMGRDRKWVKKENIEYSSCWVMIKL